MGALIEVVTGDSYFVTESKEQVLEILKQGGFVDFTIARRSGVIITVNSNLVLTVSADE